MFPHAPSANSTGMMSQRGTDSAMKRIAYASVTLPGATRDFVLDLLLLRNFSFVSMLSYPNAAMWFVPFIAGFYLVFPPLFRPVTRARGAALHSLGGRVRSWQDATTDRR